MRSLHEELERVATSPTLLVASDYDGVLAPIVDDPAQAHPAPAPLEALRRLALLEQTYGAVISGRAIGDLRALLGCEPQGGARPCGSLHLVGSHGAEGELVAEHDREEETRRDLLRFVVSELEAIAAGAPGLRLEAKPFGAALHYRQALPRDGARARAVALAGPGSREGVRVKEGKKVVEFAVTGADKGSALQRLRYRLGAAAVLFIGDDITDEDAFGVLGPVDLGVKVGEEPTRATLTIPDAADVAPLLDKLLELRRSWLDAIRPTPIERLTMLSDQRTVALVDPRARVTWLCTPRVDSPALFAEVLGGPDAGTFEIGPAEGGDAVGQRYVGDSLVLETHWPGLTVTDYLDCSGGRPYQRAGRTDLVRVIEGRGRVRIRFAPRLDFGRFPTRLELRERGITVRDTPDPIALLAPGVTWTIVQEGRHEAAMAEFELPGAPVVLELRYGAGTLRDASTPEPARRAQTEQFWSTWAAGLALPPLAPELVKRSALAIRGLCYGPTGALAAAATTSLPEHAGGVRNWDYRCCWPRDSALAAASLVRLGSIGPAMRFLDWLLDVLDECESPERLRPVYTVTGAQLGPEGEIGELFGHRASRPVRIGNAAGLQVQLDVFGPIVDLVALLAHHGAPISPEHWRLVEAMVTAVQRRWREPDHGIWEIRHEPRHHVHSKVMCWLTVDRALTLAEHFLGAPREDWAGVRDAIAADILEHGWSRTSGAFTGAYGLDEIDAAALFVGLSGLVSPHDPRFVATVREVERRLLDWPVVRRYRSDDGLPGEEGGFHICTSWLIESYALLGRMDDAMRLFEAMARLAGHTGLLSEQYEPRTGLALGNHPQAYSHLGIINCAVRLSGG